MAKVITIYFYLMIACCFIFYRFSCPQRKIVCSMSLWVPWRKVGLGICTDTRSESACPVYCRICPTLVQRLVQVRTHQLSSKIVSWNPDLTTYQLWILLKSFTYLGLGFFIFQLRTVPLWPSMAMHKVKSNNASPLRTRPDSVSFSDPLFPHRGTLLERTGNLDICFSTLCLQVEHGGLTFSGWQGPTGCPLVLLYNTFLFF